jgi:hypothetical protein
MEHERQGTCPERGHTDNKRFAPRMQEPDARVTRRQKDDACRSAGARSRDSRSQRNEESRGLARRENGRLRITKQALRNTAAPPNGADDMRSARHDIPARSTSRPSPRVGRARMGLGPSDVTTTEAFSIKTTLTR